MARDDGIARRAEYFRTEGGLIMLMDYPFHGEAHEAELARGTLVRWNGPDIQDGPADEPVPPALPTYDELTAELETLRAKARPEDVDQLGGQLQQLRAERDDLARQLAEVCEHRDALLVELDATKEALRTSGQPAPGPRAAKAGKA